MWIGLALALNDSAVMGVGGTVSALDTTTPVRMVRERIDIHMGQRKVNAEFLFQNTANAPTRVLMGFPEEGGGDIEVPGPNRSTWFKSFRSWVDGEPVAVQRRPSEGDDMFYKQWWTKEVTFAARQERTVRNEYVTTLGGSATGISWLTYVLSTGRPWQGTIGEAVITVDLAGIPRNAWIGARPANYVRQGDKLVWVKRNFEPAEDEEVVVAYWVQVKGSPIVRPDELRMQYGPIFQRD